MGICGMSAREWVISPGRSLSKSCFLFSGFRPGGVPFSCRSCVCGEVAGSFLLVIASCVSQQLPVFTSEFIGLGIRQVLAGIPGACNGPPRAMHCSVLPPSAVLGVFPLLPYVRGWSSWSVFCFPWSGVFAPSRRFPVFRSLGKLASGCLQCITVCVVWVGVYRQ